MQSNGTAIRLWRRTALAALAVALPAAAAFVPSELTPPPVPREFRGAWVASVGNIDWPSRRNLTTGQQQAELIALLDRAVQLRLNAILLQVRPACDAFYASKFEPWSEYLTGQMGRAPQPYYDPLAFAVQEAHRRGLELHAWFNPFRVRHLSAVGSVSRDHISRAQPNLVRTYGKQLWLDPGEAAVRDYSVRVILDVVKRYDVDGVHIDDYFYPYPEKDRAGKPIDFPDWTSWKKYLNTGGKMTRGDWRRNNVNQFVQRLHQSVKEVKPLVKVGISPFGIWRPGQPAQIKGFDAYALLYADARLWLGKGWLDYLVPQLYWPSDQPAQSYPVLLNWWHEQNPLRRHLWPGNAHSNPPDEILNQIRLTRRQAGAGGNVHWSIKALMQNRRGVADALLRDVYARPALVPASPWLDRTAPARPQLQLDATRAGVLRANWRAATNSEPVRLWVLQSRTEGEWRLDILPGQHSGREWLSSRTPDVVALAAVDRAGNLSPSIVLERAAAPARQP